jgi:hypothetical protein
MGDAEDLRFVPADRQVTYKGDEEREARLRLDQIEAKLAKEKELELRLDQVEAKLGKTTFSPGAVTLIAAVIGLLGATLGSYFQGQSNLSVERLKFESTLILDALKADSQSVAAQRLDFLVKARLIDGREGAISALTRQPSDLPIRTLQTRLKELEGEVSVSRCVEKGGVFDAGTFRCIPVAN